MERVNDAALGAACRNGACLRVTRVLTKRLNTKDTKANLRIPLKKGSVYRTSLFLSIFMIKGCESLTFLLLPKETLTEMYIVQA